MRFIKSFAILLVPFLTWSYTNYNGTTETVSISDTIDSATIYYSDAVSFSGDNGNEDIDVVVKVDDTVSSGFANDSVNFYYGIQIGHLVADGDSGALDTAWKSKSIVDTFRTEDYGTETVGTMTSAGVFSHSLGDVDTSSVRQYAIQTHTIRNRILGISPGFGYVIRFWVYGLGTVSSSAQSTRPIELIFDVKKSHYIVIKNTKYK